MFFYVGATPPGSGEGEGGFLLSAGGSFSTRPPAITTSCVSFGDAIYYIIFIGGLLPRL